VDVVADFIADDVDLNKKKGGGGRRGRMTEEAEDKIMLKDDEAAVRHTRLVVQPSLIKNGKLRDYQLEGLNWLIKLYESNVNGILADEMVSSLGLLSYSFSLLLQ
jgi:SNF2 family DNA or RNA helicase